ncbi:MAG: hypothetical protein AAGJ52_15025, partial [Pseudomonadota bacterium]
PLSVGPGQDVPIAASQIDAPGVLGDNRFLAPALSEDAPGGSNASSSIGGGQFLCQVSVTVIDPENSNGGCGVAWTAMGETAFDFTQINAFEFNVLQADGNPIFAISATDGNQTLATAFIENIPVGLASVPRDAFISPINPIDWSAVLTLQVTILNSEGTNMTFRMGAMGSDTGVIPGTVPAPQPASDGELSDTVSGGWFSPSRGGEGCQITREADGITFILTCYTYFDGEQVWMLGTGSLLNGQVIAADMVITEGASYGPLFDPEDVVLIPFGTVSINFIDCNTAAVAMTSVVDGYEPVLLPMERLVPINCAGGLPDPANARRTGNWFDQNRGGEGFQLTVEGNNGLHILTFYTYIDGRPAWMLATGTISGNRIEFNDPVLTTGTGFGSSFDPDDVELIPFGRFIMEFSDCNNAQLIADSDRAELPDQTYSLTRIVPGPCS